MLEPEQSILHGFIEKSCLAKAWYLLAGLIKGVWKLFLMAQRKTGRACVFVLRLQTIPSSRAPLMSVVVPDILSPFSLEKSNLKQELLSGPKSSMLVLIKTMSLMDKDISLGTPWGMFCCI